MRFETNQQHDSNDYLNIETLMRMNKSIYGTAIPFDPYKCKLVPQSRAFVCGSDGKSYTNQWYLMCTQKEEYGIRLNLQLQHDGRCFPWEAFGISNSTMLFVSYF